MNPKKSAFPPQPPPSSQLDAGHSSHPSANSDQIQRQMQLVGLAKVVPTVLLLWDAAPRADQGGANNVDPGLKLVLHEAARMLSDVGDDHQAVRVALLAAQGEQPESQIQRYLDVPIDEHAIAVLRHFAPTLTDIVTLNEWRIQHGVKRSMAQYWALQGRLLGAFRSPDIEKGTWLVRKDAPKPTGLKRGPPKGRPLKRLREEQAQEALTETHD